MLETDKNSLTKPMSQYLLQKLSKFYEYDDALSEAVMQLCDNLEEFPAGTYFARQEADYTGVYLIDNGWVLRSKTLETGARQIVSVAMPGDFVGLNSLLFMKSDFDLLPKRMCRPITAKSSVFSA